MKLPRFLTHFNFFHRPFRSRKGISIVISLIMVNIILLQMAGMAQRNTESLELRKSYFNTRQGYWNARSGLEMGLYTVTHPKEMRKLVESGKEKITYDETTRKYTYDLAEPTTIPNTAPLKSGASWIINNQSLDIPQSYNANGVTENGYHIFPFPGSGNLGSEKCDIEKMKTAGMQHSDGQDFMKEMASLQGIDPAVYEEADYQYPFDGIDYLDYPCFWNTLEQGKTESIRLYTESEGCPLDGFGAHVCNPADVGMKSLILRIRTPCKDGKIICTPGERRKLASGLDKKRIVLWDINADCQELKGSKKHCYFTGWEDGEENINIKIKENATESVIFGEEVSYDVLYPTNPLFTALDFSKGYPDDLKNKPLDLEKISPYPPFLLSALKNESPWNTVFKNITRPKMELSISSGLQDDNENIFNNLEYQILYTVDNAQLNSFGLSSFITNPIVIAEGWHGSFRTTLRTELSRPGGSFSYVYISQ